jgi:hypothetical protein
MSRDPLPKAAATIGTAKFNFKLKKTTCLGLKRIPSETRRRLDIGDTTMSTQNLALVVCSALALAAAGGRARADTIARYDCNIVGTLGQEPIGDRPGHMLVSFQYSCYGLDGLMKGALYTASIASEWENQKGSYLYSVGIHRTADSYAVVQRLEGTGAVVTKDAMPAISEASGKVVFKLASGRFAGLVGKTVNFTARLTAPGHFIYELTE